MAAHVDVDVVVITCALYTICVYEIGGRRRDERSQVYISSTRVARISSRQKCSKLQVSEGGQCAYLDMTSPSSLLCPLLLQDTTPCQSSAFPFIPAVPTEQCPFRRIRIEPLFLDVLA